jgi:hypothetical protein
LNRRLPVRQTSHFSVLVINQNKMKVIFLRATRQPSKP